MEQTVVTSGALASVILEGIKWCWRKWVAKDMTFDFPTWFYSVSLPVLNALVPFLLVLLGFVSEAPILDMGWVEGLQYVAGVLVSSIVSVVIYTTGIEPFKESVEAKKESAVG